MMAANELSNMFLNKLTTNYVYTLRQLPIIYHDCEWVSEFGFNVHGHNIGHIAQLSPNQVD